MKPIKKQKEFGTNKKPMEINEETFLQSMRPITGAPENRKHSFKILTSKYSKIVAIDHSPAYHTLEFVKSTNIEGVEKFLRKDKCDDGILQVKGTDQASVCMGNDFKQFREVFRIPYTVCPVYGNRGTGKIERLLGTVNERLRANPDLAKRQNKCGTK